MPSGEPPQGLCFPCPFLGNIQPQIIQWWLLLSTSCKGHHKKRPPLAWFWFYLPIDNCIPSFHFLPELATYRFPFLLQFSFLSLLAFVLECSGLPPSSKLSSQDTHWAVLIDARWATPSDFVRLCLFSRLKFHLILRRGPGFGLEIHRPEKSLEAWFAFDKHWDVGFLFQRLRPTHPTIPFSSKIWGKALLLSVHLSLAQPALPCKLLPAY